MQVVAVVAAVLVGVGWFGVCFAAGFLLRGSGADEADPWGGG